MLNIPWIQGQKFEQALLLANSRGRRRNVAVLFPNLRSIALLLTLQLHINVNCVISDYVSSIVKCSITLICGSTCGEWRDAGVKCSDSLLSTLRSLTKDALVFCPQQDVHGCALFVENLQYSVKRNAGRRAANILCARCKKRTKCGNSWADQNISPLKYLKYFSE